jgi:hypothetical protein
MRANLLCAFLLPALIAISATSSASAQQNTSQYTSVALKNCIKFERVIVHGGEFAAGYDCPGMPGYRVYRSEYDARTTVAIGFNRLHATKQPAGSQMFSPFNDVHDTMEWRIDSKTKKPFATILRWRIADQMDLDKDDRPKDVELLIVIRTPPGPSCHVAYIDVRANENPNVLARQAADDLALKFECAKDKVRIIGSRGRAVELSGAE